jgi:hypothetical protein
MAGKRKKDAFTEGALLALLFLLILLAIALHLNKF